MKNLFTMAMLLWCSVPVLAADAPIQAAERWQPFSKGLESFGMMTIDAKTIQWDDQPKSNYSLFSASGSIRVIQLKQPNAMFPTFKILRLERTKMAMGNQQTLDVSFFSSIDNFRKNKKSMWGIYVPGAN